MKTVNVTSKTTMNLPDTFTMKELAKFNPSVKAPTLYQRIQKLKKDGVIVEMGDVKRPTSKEKGITKGRTEVVYSTKDANPNNNLIRQAKAQGRLRADVISDDKTSSCEASDVEAVNEARA